MKKDLTVEFQDYWKDFSADDFKTPRATIGMGSPSQGKKLGHYNFSTGESLEKLEGVSFLARTNGFVLYGGTGSIPPRCASDDGVMPAPRIESPVSPACGPCFAKEWGFDPAKDQIQLDLKLPLKGEQPVCQTTISLVLSNSDGIPFVLTVKTFNVKIVKQYLFTALKMKSIAYKVPPFGVTFDLGLKALEGLGNRHEVTVSNWRKLEPDEIEMRHNLYDMFAHRAREIVEVDLDETPF